MRPAKTLVRLMMCLSFVGSASALEFLSDETQGTKGPEVLTRSIGARAAGLGGAGVPMAEDASAVYWNPAWLNELGRSEALFSHESGFSGERLDALALARPVWWNGRRRTVGGGVTYLSQDSFEVKVDDESLGQASPYELVASVCYAQPWGRGSMGMTAKYVRQKLYSTSAQAFAVDIGVAGSGTWWRMGGAVTNLGPPLTGNGESVGLPLAIKGGAAVQVWGRPKGQLWTLVQADAPADDRLVTHGGLEYRSFVLERWRFDLRAGYQENGVGEGPTAGFGFSREGWGVNYAFQIQKEVGDAHRLDLVMRFGNGLPEEAHRDALLGRGEKEISDGRLLEAGNTVAELGKLTPRDPAVQHLRRELEKRFSESIDPRTLFSQGRQSFDGGEYGKAVDFFEKLLVVEPKYPAGKEWLDRSLMEVEAARIGRWKTEVNRAKEKERVAQTALAHGLESSERWEEAVAAWRRGKELGLSPKDVQQGLARCRGGLLEIASRKEKDQDWEGALAATKAALATGDPDQDLSDQMSRLERAKTDARGRNAQAKYIEGMDAYQAGDSDRARRLFQQAVELAPEDQTYQRALERTNAEKRTP